MPPKQASGSLKRKRKAKQVALIKSQKGAKNKFLKKQDAGPSNVDEQNDGNGNDNVEDVVNDNVDVNVEDFVNENVDVNMEEDDARANVEKDDVDIFDPRNWRLLSPNMINKLVEQGPKQNSTIKNGPRDKYGRRFNNSVFTRILPNMETCDREWLVYSQVLDKLFCFCCKLFRKGIPKGGLDSEGFCDWQHVHRSVKQHESSSEHMKCMNTWVEMRQRLKENETIDKVAYGLFKVDMDLSPKLAKKLYGGAGGSYHTWSPDELPMLRQGNIGAGKLLLSKNGLALPRYSDSAKVAYVLQGSGVAGIVLPEKEEKVLEIKTGDTIALPFGVITWWYNKDDTELQVLFLGDTKTAHKAGSFTDFFLTGSNGIFTGFSTEFVCRAWDVDEATAKSLVGNQKDNGIIKVDAGAKMPEPNKDHRNGMALNCLEAPLDVDIDGGGRVVVLNTKNLPLVGEVGLGADLVRLDGNAMCSPGFSCDSALQVTYIVRGSGRAQVVGVDGKRVLDTTVKGGDLFIVPRFFVVSKIADNEGLEWFSIISTPNPIFTHMAGRTSAWKALSPEVLHASFNVTPEVEKTFRSKRMNSEIFFAPSK